MKITHKDVVIETESVDEAVALINKLREINVAKITRIYNGRKTKGRHIWTSTELRFIINNPNRKAIFYHTNVILAAHTKEAIGTMVWRIKSRMLLTKKTARILTENNG